MSRNVEDEYRWALLDFYASIGCAEYAASRIRLHAPRQSHVFCSSCCWLFVPKINCQTKSDDKKFTIICNGCAGEFKFRKGES